MNNDVKSNNICPLCGQEINTTKGVTTVLKQLVHEKCLYASTEEKWERAAVKERIKVIWTKAGIEKINYPYFSKQIERIKQEYDISYRQMLRALRWFFEIEENPVTEESSMEIIPWIVHKSDEYFKIKENAVLHNKTWWVLDQQILIDYKDTRKFMPYINDKEFIKRIRKSLMKPLPEDFDLSCFDSNFDSSKLPEYVPYVPTEEELKETIQADTFDELLDELERLNLL